MLPGDRIWFSIILFGKVLGLKAGKRGPYYASEAKSHILSTASDDSLLTNLLTVILRLNDFFCGIVRPLSTALVLGRFRQPFRTRNQLSRLFSGVFWLYLDAGHAVPQPMT